MSDVGMRAYWAKLAEGRAEHEIRMLEMESGGRRAGRARKRAWKAMSALSEADFHWLALTVEMLTRFA